MPNIITFNHAPQGLQAGIEGVGAAFAGANLARRQALEEDLARRGDLRREEEHQAKLEGLGIENDLQRLRLQLAPIEFTSKLEQRYTDERMAKRRLDLYDEELDIRRQSLQAELEADESGREGIRALAEGGLFGDLGPEELDALEGMDPKTALGVLELGAQARAQEYQAHQNRRAAERLNLFAEQVGPDGMPLPQAGGEGGPPPLVGAQESAELLRKLGEGKISAAEVDGLIEDRLNEHARESARQQRHSQLEGWATGMLETTQVDPFEPEFMDALATLNKWIARRSDPDADPEVFRDQFLLALFPSTFDRVQREAVRELSITDPTRPAPPDQGPAFATGTELDQAPPGMVGSPAQRPRPSAPGSAPPAPAVNGAGRPAPPGEKAPGGAAPPESTPPVGAYQLGQIRDAVAAQVVREDLTAEQAAELFTEALGRPVTAEEAEEILFSTPPDRPDRKEQSATNRRALERAVSEFGSAGPF